MHVLMARKQSHAFLKPIFRKKNKTINKINCHYLLFLPLHSTVLHIHFKVTFLCLRSPQRVPADFFSFIVLTSLRANDN